MLTADFAATFGRLPANHPQPGSQPFDFVIIDHIEREPTGN